MVDGDLLADRYRRNRERSRALFDLLSDAAYYAQPIALRHPIVFYEGHLPAFSFNTLVKKALGGRSIDTGLETLFARGIDPSESAADGGRRFEWPGREDVRAFAKEADERVLQALTSADLDRPGDPLLDRAEAAFTILEHEAMHQETLLYMWHRLPLEEKRRPEAYRPRVDGSAPANDWVDIPPGPATLGAERDEIAFGWDNEFVSHTVNVPAFQMERHNVTNEDFLDFVNAGGYRQAQWWRPEDWAWLQGDRVEHPLFWERHGGDWYWRAMFALIPLPPAWPVYVSQAEASACAQWRGARLPTEAEFQRAAYGGSRPPDLTHGVCDFKSWDPEPAGTHPSGRSAWGVDDLLGNGWEWTRSVFEPFQGFRPMASYPEYSTDFFDGQHFVMKGASPATARELIRPSFRNWFRARYPYVYATFRCVRNLPATFVIT